MQGFLNSKFATFLLSAALILVIGLTAKVLVQKRVIDKEVARLKSQMERVKKDNEQLSSLVQYLNTPEYKEKEAREKLNLAKEGEHVVVLPVGDAAASQTQQTTESKLSNHKLWFNYFFDDAN